MPEENKTAAQREADKRQAKADDRVDELNKQIEDSDAPVDKTKIGSGLSDPDPGGVNLPNAGDPKAESARTAGEGIGTTVNTVTGKRLSPDETADLVDRRNKAQGETDKAMGASKDDPDKLRDAIREAPSTDREP